MDFTFDPLAFHHPSRRNPVYASRGMVATSNPLAAQAGLEILQQGGNAFDAAIATAAALTVVEPTSNGIGGDAFCQAWTGQTLIGLNASGPCPQALTPQVFQDRGLDQIPMSGLLPITVPGVPAAWANLVQTHGNLPLPQVLAPAIRLARHGFALQPTVAYYWAFAARRYRELAKTDPIFQHWLDTFTIDGDAPSAGQIFHLPSHADTLEEIAATSSESFYRGPLARTMDSFMHTNGGFLSFEDLQAYSPERVQPLRQSYGPFEICELPPNSQGIATLIALGILRVAGKRYDGSLASLHFAIEAIKLGMITCAAYVADPRAMSIIPDALLEPDFLVSLANRITESAQDFGSMQPATGGTVYLATADTDGHMVSYIQSNYGGFGSGVVVPGTGISLQNRGANFNLIPGHPNCLAPGKRTYHTIIPGFLMQNNQPVGPFGLMGGYMQPMGHFQLILNCLDLGYNPQDALDAPRWQWMRGREIEVESGFDPNLAEGLRNLGHDVRVADSSGPFGRGQIIWRNPEGVLCGGTEPRTDSAIAAW